MSDPTFLRRHAAGVTVDLRVQPRARRSVLAGAGAMLKAAVTAPPENGRANEAVIALLAQSWRLPKSSIEIVKGASTRTKSIGIAGEPAELADRIAQWTESHD